LEPALAALRAELQLPDDHPPAVQAEAAAAIAQGPRLPPGVTAGWIDATDVPFVTVDPPGSRDLDQALHLEVRPDGGERGFRVHYAIADVAAFVAPGGAIDAEAWQRGVTLYLPDRSARLHPVGLAEGAASLLDDGADRPCVLWQLDLDGRGELTGCLVRRAMVRSRRRLSYAEAQRLAERAAAERRPEVGGLELLAEIGRARQQLELQRGGVSLQLPEQEVVAQGGRYRLAYRRPLPVEGWNAQLSLLAGIAAAGLMAAAGRGVVRVLPDPDPSDLGELRRSAAALGVAWPAGEPYAAFVRRLDPDDGPQAALLQQAARTLRGAGYAVLDGTGAPRHAALATSYAHVTAPLRRLVDRYAAEIAVALCAGRPIPAWVEERLDGLPAAMASAGQRAAQVDAAVLDLVEALVLRDQVGASFTATVIASNDKRSKVQLRDPAVVATTVAGLPLGAEVALELVQADPARRLVHFSPPANPHGPAAG
jgi:exoribonuclease R